MAWVANKGQIIQIVLTFFGCVFGGIKAWPDLKGNQFLSVGAILFYLLIGLVVAVLGRAITTVRKGEREAPSNEQGRGEIGDRAKNANEMVTLQATILDPRSTDPKVNYKAKFRCIFTNRSGQNIEILRPSWLTGIGDVTVQAPLGTLYQIEESAGSWKQNKWKKQELETAYISAGQSFRVWIGLDTSKSHEELEKRRNTQQLGTLVIPFRFDNREYKLEESV